MRPKPEIFCPVVPFDRDVSRMTEEELRGYAASLPSAEFPPVRWTGDGMDDLRHPDGSRFGPPPADDLAPLFGRGAGEWQSISNRTVVDLGALARAFERRCAAEAGPDPRHRPPLVLMRCLIKRCDLEGLSAGFNLRVLTCVFVEEARFSFAHLARGVDLLGSIFAGEAHFTGTTIREMAHFHAVAFLRGVWFHETRFEGDTRFNESAFNGPLSLEHARLAEALDLSHAILRGVTWIDLAGMRVSGRTALAGDLKAGLEQIQWRILGEHGESLSPPYQPAPDRRERAGALEYAADQYSTLAGNFAASTGPGSWRAADWCHSRYLDLWRRIAWLRRDYWSWLKSFFFKICLGNGIWLKYPLELALVVILGCGLAYAVAFAPDIRADQGVLTAGGSAAHGGVAGAAPIAGAAPAAGAPEVSCLRDVHPAHLRVATALYFSAITFTTVGYGDWHPVGWARLVAAAEALSGITIMSAFTVILVRKIIR
jgi:hypothetical protein